MSLRRDEFAKAALTGLLACPYRNGDTPDFVEDAVKFADALITELNKTTQPPKGLEGTD